MFANLVAELASEFTNKVDFVRALQQKFTQDKDRLSWGSEGFKTQFKDDVGPGNSPNQVRHYVGGLYAGFQLGSFLGNLAANFRELQVGRDRFPPSKGWPDVPAPYVSPSGEADMALNDVATAHGGALVSGDLKPDGLADKIRQDVCN